MKKVKIPIDIVVMIMPEMGNLGGLPRKKKKQMKKEFSKVFMDKFYKWLEDGKSGI